MIKLQFQINKLIVQQNQNQDSSGSGKDQIKSNSKRKYFRYGNKNYIIKDCFKSQENLLIKPKNPGLDTKQKI